MSEPARVRIPVAPDVVLSAIVREADPGAPVPAIAVPFLLIHGLASNARLWDGVACELSRRGYRSVAVDLRGHGRSDKPDSGYDFATVTSDLVALIGTLGLDRPVVTGQSWGGNVVLELAARSPSSLRGVVAVDGGTIELSEAFPDWSACSRALAPPRLAGLPLVEMEGWLRRAHPDWPEEGIAGALGNFEVLLDGTIVPWLSRQRHMAILRELWGHHPSQRFGEVGVPVLLVPAERDGEPAERLAHGRAATERALAAIPRASAHVFRPADHDLHAQHPVELSNVMVDALNGGFFG